MVKNPYKSNVEKDTIVATFVKYKGKEAKFKVIVNGIPVTGIEIDSNAAIQAEENVKNSPWSERIEIVNCDFLEYDTSKRFDTIVCNPPYFVNSLKCDRSQRTLARHSDSLNCKEFFAKCAEISTDTATVNIIIPSDIAEEWLSAAKENGFKSLQKEEK